NCEDSTAKCVPLTCHFDYVGTKESALIEIRARLWNYTFSGDYSGIEYVAITSKGHIELDPAQGIIEDSTNNFARVVTQAYPDRPQQEMKITWWLLLLAVLIALLLLAILILILVKCGFFKRKRPGDPLLHQAEYSYQREQYTET
uniref:Integrin alpha third immunoglobulin-like domain-containing protein n=1 Tax=Acrobeloides nanus TaxID=290746 RepID=A0A914D0Q8_9BILA